MDLHEYVQGIADSSGTVEVATGPGKFGEQWDISLITTNTNSTAQAQLRVYRGAVADTAQILSTYAANNDTASGSTISVRAGDKLVFVWSNADPGSICTARIEGELISGRR